MEFTKFRNKAQKSKAGRKGSALGNFRTTLYKFGSNAGNVNAFLQRPFVQNARRNAYTAARGAGFVSALTTGDFKRKYGSVQGSIVRASRVATGRLTGMAIQQMVPRGLGPIAGRFARQQLGRHISKSPFYQNANRKIESVLTGFFNSEAVPHYKHIVDNMNIREVMDLQIQRTHDLMKASAPDISSGQYMLGVGADQLGLDIRDKYLNQTMYNEEKGMVFDENFSITTKMGNRRNDRLQQMDIFGFTEPGQAYKFLTESIHLHRVKTDKSAKYLFKGGVSVGGKNKTSRYADHFPWIWLVEYGGPIVQPVAKWDKKKKKTVNEDVKKYIPPTLFVTRSVKAVNNVRFKGAKVRMNLAAPKVAGFKNPLAYMQDVLGTRGGYGKMVKNQGMRVKRKGRVTYKEKSLYSALNRKDQGRTGSMGVKRGNITGRNRRYYKYQDKHQIPGVKVHSTHGVQYSKELQDAIGVSFTPAEITAEVNFKNVGKIKGGVSGREKLLTDLLTQKNPTKAGDRGVGVLHDAEMLNSLHGFEKYGEDRFNSQMASSFIDFDSFDVSANTGFGKVPKKNLANYIKKNYDVKVKRAGGPGGSGNYKVIFTSKAATTKKRKSRSASSKRFNKGARRPLQTFDKDTKKAARALVENANYEEIIRAATFFDN